MSATGAPVARPARLFRGALAAGFVAAAVLACWLVGVLDGVVGLAFAGVLVCLLPLSSHLPGRLLAAGALFLAWVPFLWWLRLPLGSVGRVGLVLTVAAAALAGWLFSGDDLRGRARRLRPEVGSVDLIPVAMAGAATWAAWPLATSPGAERTVTVLLRGWDHVAHFGMFRLLQNEGVISPFLGDAPDGTTWVGSGYPQHFHAAVAAIVELMNGPGAADPTVSMVSYGRALALMLVLLAALLGAAVASLLRSRPATAWPVAGLVTAAFVFGPGTMALATGFPNFVLACAAAGLAVLVAMSAVSEPQSSLRLAVVGSLVVVTVHAWVLVAPLAAVAMAAAVAPTVSRCRTRPVVSLDGSARAVVVLTAVACIAVLLVLLPGEEGALAIGGPPHVTLAQFVVATGASLGLALVVSRQAAPGSQMASRLLLIGVPVVGLLMLSGLAAYQLVEAGALSYYFGKLATGVTLVSVAALAAAVAAFARSGSGASRGGTPSRALAAVALTLAATQVYGYVGPAWQTPVADPAPILQYRAAVAPGADQAPAARILAASKVAASRPFGSTAYLAALPGDPIPVLADQWVRALTTTWSSRKAGSVSLALARVGTAFGEGRLSVTSVSRRLLRSAPGLVVVVAPELVRDLRASLPVPDRDRVVTW